MSSWQADQPASPGQRSFEWFRSLSEVPGVTWRSPDWVEVDPRLAGAYPVEDSAAYSPTGFVWVDQGGAPLGDDYSRYQSPAELVLEGRYEIEDPDRATLTTCQALAHPGTRFDYHAALSWLPDVPSVPGAWVEAVLRADVELVLVNPLSALASPRWADDTDRALAGASAPILRLMHLYLAEGFLVEAAEVECLLERLPPAGQPRYDYGPRPEQVVEGLRALAP